MRQSIRAPEKRERKLFDKEQQVEVKRPKSPERYDVQQAEQHGSEGEVWCEERRRKWVEDDKEMINEGKKKWVEDYDEIYEGRRKDAMS